MSSTTYPVHVEAELDNRLSRWLWLVKWLLVLPHYVILAFLWLAFAVLSVAAFVVILFSGRYPRAVFDFNVGVMRWTWRVAYYAYGALGTDRYPPFSLRDDPGYPAHLDVDYPEHLSRGLVLVKWWLLAIPHYVVIGLLLGGAGYAVRAGDDEPFVWDAGLIGLLVLVAGVALLVTGRYPQPLFDLVLGLNRWVLRVAGYAALMTDRYPPFGLDQGGHEDGGRAFVQPAPQPLAPSTADTAGPGQPARVSAWTAGRVVSLVLGSALVLLSVGLGLPAGALVVADLGGRDDAGFLMSPPRTLSTTTYAVTSASMDLHVDAPPSFTPDALIGDTKITVDPRGSAAVFVGLAPTASVRAYLDGVERAELTGFDNAQPVLVDESGTAPAVAPDRADIWTVSSSGTGTQSLVWTPKNGDWTLVVMNADGSAGVAVDATAGAEVPALEWVIAALLVLAGLSLLVGILLIAVPMRRAATSGVRTQ